jgi:hypothetical protein
MALFLLAEKFLQSLKASAETAQAEESVGYSTVLTSILRDCRSLKIDLDISWYHLLLDLLE